MTKLEKFARENNNTVDLKERYNGQVQFKQEKDFLKLDKIMQGRKNDSDVINGIKSNFLESLYDINKIIVKDRDYEVI